MDLKRYKTEMDKLRARIKELDGIARDLDRRSEQERGAESALQQLQTFCHRVSVGLDRMSFEERQELLRLVVDRIPVEDETVGIETVITQGDGYSQLRTRHADNVEDLLGCCGYRDFRAVRKICHILILDLNRLEIPGISKIQRPDRAIDARLPDLTCAPNQTSTSIGTPIYRCRYLV